MNKKRIDKVWVDQNCVYARTTDAIIANYPFSMWKRLSEGSEEERSDFFLSYTGIHWPRLDEDLSFEGMFAYSGHCARTETEDSVYWEA